MDDLEILFKIHHGLPRQGPGTDEYTQKAFYLMKNLP
jgi:hypothetical protein